jgi:hypothetical protein
MLMSKQRPDPEEHVMGPKVSGHLYPPDPPSRRVLTLHAMFQSSTEKKKKKSNCPLGTCLARLTGENTVQKPEYS